MATTVVLGGRVELEGDVIVVSKFAKISKEAKRTEKGFVAVDKSSRKAAQGVDTMGVSAGKLGSVLKDGGAKLAKFAAGATVALAGIGVAGVKAFGDFEGNMARVGTLLPDGVDGMERFGSAVEGASLKFGQSVEKTADAFFQGISAGVPFEKIEEFTETVGKAATGASVDMAVAVDGLTTVINGYGLEVEQAEEISDKLFVANKLGKTTFGDLASSMGLIVPQAAALGVDVDDILASVVSLTKAGVSTRSSITGLRQVLVSVQKPTAEAIKVAEDLSLGFDVASLKSKGLAGFMEELKEKTGGNQEIMAKLFGSVEALGVATRLTSEVGIKELTNSLGELENAAGATESANARMAAATDFKIKQIKQGFAGLIRAVGEGLGAGFDLGAIENIPETMQRLADGIKDGAQAFAEGFADVVGPVGELGEIDLKGIGSSIGKFAGRITQAFGLVIDIAGVLMDTFGLMSDNIVPIAALIGSSVSFAFGPAIFAITTLVGLAATLADKWQPAADFFKGIGGEIMVAWEPVNQFFVDLWADIIGAFESAGAEIGEVVDDVVDLVSTITVGLGISDEPSTVTTAPLTAKDQAVVNEGLVSLEQGVGEGMASLTAGFQNLLGFQSDQQIEAEKSIAGFREAGKAGSLALQSIRGELALAGQELGKLTAPLLENFNIDLTLNQEVKTNIDTKKRRPKKTRTRFERGKGDATIPSTFENTFIMFGDELLPIPDNFTITAQES